MTNKEYCEKSLNSNNIIKWVLKDGFTFNETDENEAFSEMEFVRFQNAKVLRIETNNGFDVVYLDIEKLLIK